MKRLEKFTNKDLATEKITVEYINDITVGWDIDEVSYSEVIELLRRLAKKMLQENIEIPNHLWNGWIYVILMNESPEKSRIPSFKYLGRPNSIPQTEKIRAIDIFLTDMDVFQKSNSFAINQVNRLFNFLLEFETCSSDVNVLLRGFLKFDQNLRSSLIWEKIIVKFMYYKCLPFEDIVELLRIMILDEEKAPSDHFAPVLKHWIYENRNTYNSFSSRFIDRIGFTKLNTLNNLLIVAFLDADHSTYALRLIRNQLLKSKKGISADVIGYTIFRLFKMKKNLAAFSLMKDLCPSTWDIKYPEAINTKLQYAESRNYPEINAADFHDYIISGLIVGGFPALARQLFDQCEENGFQKSEKLYNLMAQGHFTVALPSIDQGKFMISCLLAKGLKVYRKTYLDYISALYSIDKKDELMEVIGILFKKYGADLPTYTLILKLNLPIEGVQSHSDLLAHMLRNQVKPDARFFCVLLNNISKKGSYSDILEVFEISRNHIRPTVGMYSIFIKSLVKLDQMDEAEKWIVRMIQDRCKPNRVTYSTLMNAYLQKGNFSRGLYYFGKMIGYQFHDNTLAYLSPSERADNTAIWSLLNYMLNNGMIETLQFVFGKTLSAGFKLQNWRTVQIVDILLEAGYLWPIVLIPDFKNSVDQMNSLIKAESLVAMSSASDEHQDHILVKLEKKIQDFAHSIHGGPVLIRYQWVIVKLLTEKTLLNQFFEENEISYAKYTLQLILIRIVQSRVDFNASTISVDKEPLRIFLNDIDNKLTKDKLGKFAAPVLPFELPSFRPKITDNSTNENDDAIIELAPPYFEKKTIPRVETVSTIATDMFPLLVGCVSLYHSFNPILKNSSTSTVENQLPSHLPQMPYQASNPVNVGLNPKLALKGWNVSKNMLLKLTSDQEKVVKATLVHLGDKNEIINRENIDKACEQLAMIQPELKSVFKWLSKYNFRSSLVKKYKDLVYQ